MPDTEEMFLFAPKRTLLYLLTFVVFVGSHAQTQAGPLEPVANADKATLVMRVEPYKADESEPLPSVIRSMARLSMNYKTLLKPHAKAHGKIFNRVTLDMDGTRAERGMATEPLLDLAKKENRLPAALMERMYDARKRWSWLAKSWLHLDSTPRHFGQNFL